jgi:hypothetical protein
MLEKLLRFPLPDQLKAVAEKIDSLDDASSDGRISSWVRSSSSLSKYERWVLRRALRRRERVMTLCEAMTLVITPEPTHGDYLTGRINFLDNSGWVIRGKPLNHLTNTIDGVPCENYDTLTRKFVPRMFGTIK